MNKKDDIYGLDGVKKSIEDEIERAEKIRDLSEQLRSISTDNLIKLNTELEKKFKNTNQIIHDMQPELQEKIKRASEIMTKIDNEIRRQENQSKKTNKKTE